MPCCSTKDSVEDFTGWIVT